MESPPFSSVTLPFKKKLQVFFPLTPQCQKAESLHAIPPHSRSAVSPEPGGLRLPAAFPPGNSRPVVTDSTCVLNKLQVPKDTHPHPAVPRSNTLLITKSLRSRSEGHFHSEKTVVTPLPSSFTPTNPTCSTCSLPPRIDMSFGFPLSRVSLDPIKDWALLVHSSPRVLSDFPSPREGRQPGDPLS